jgi:hypothetical protein
VGCSSGTDGGPPGGPGGQGGTGAGGNWGGTGRGGSGGGGQARCEVDGLTVGARPQVWVSGAECLSRDALPPLLPGLNRATVPCRRLRVVEGVVRQRTPSPPPDMIDVRCGKRAKAAARSFMIRTFCEASERELKYRFDGTQGWRSVALDEGAGPLLVELPAP